MINHGRRYLAAFFVFIFTFLLQAKAGSTVRELSLQQFVKEACLRDTVFQEILADELTLMYRKSLRLPSKDIVIGLGSQYRMLFDPDEGDIENYISLSRLFPSAGTEFSAAYSSALNTQSRQTGSKFSVAVSQPIARNAFGRNTRLLDKIIGLEINVAEYQIVEAYEDYLASLIKLYYDWYSAYENLRTAEAALADNMKLLDNIKERQRNKIALPIDVNKIRLQVIAKKENLITRENEYSEYLVMIQQAIRSGENDRIVPETPQLYADIPADFSENYRIFSEESRTARLLQLLEKKSGLELDRSADELFPSLNLFAGYSSEGRGHSMDSGQDAVFAGVSLGWPFPMHVERAKYETAKIDAHKTKLSSVNTRMRLYANLSTINSRMEREKRLIDIAEEKIFLAQSIVNDETENYTMGKSTLNDLIYEINKLEDNKFSKIFHEMEYKKLVIEWLRMTDSLVQKNDVIPGE